MNPRKPLDPEPADPGFTTANTEPAPPGDDDSGPPTRRDRPPMPPAPPGSWSDQGDAGEERDVHAPSRSQSIMSSSERSDDPNGPTSVRSAEAELRDRLVVLEKQRETLEL